MNVEPCTCGPAGGYIGFILVGEQAHAEQTQSQLDRKKQFPMTGPSENSTDIASHRWADATLEQLRAAYVVTGAADFQASPDQTLQNTKYIT